MERAVHELGDVLVPKGPPSWLASWSLLEHMLTPGGTNYKLGFGTDSDSSKRLERLRDWDSSMYCRRINCLFGDLVDASRMFEYGVLFMQPVLISICKTLEEPFGQKVYLDNKIRESGKRPLVSRA